MEPFPFLVYLADAKVVILKCEMPRKIDINVENKEQFFQTSGPMGIFTWVISSDILYCDALVARTFGFAPAEVLSGLPIKRFLARIHPDDLLAVGNAIRIAIVTGEPYQKDYRVCRPDSTIKEVSAFGSCFRDSTGQPSHYSGIILPTEMLAPAGDDLLSYCYKAYEIAIRTGRTEAAGKILEVIAVVGEDIESTATTGPKTIHH